MALGRPITLTDNVASKIVSTTATSGQTVFTVTGGYRINAISVYRNGVRLVDDSDFTAIDGVNVTLLSGATLGDVLEFQIFDDFRVADAILKNNSNQIIGGDITVTGTLSGASIGIQSSGSLIGAGKTLNFIGSGNTFRQVGDTIDVSIGATAINTGTTKVQTSTPGISNEVGGLGIGTFSGAGLNVTGVVTATSFTGALSGDIVGAAVTTDSQGIRVAGIVTASSFVGDGANLTGVISGIEVQEEGSQVGTSITMVNFVGSDITATAAGSASTITVSVTVPAGWNELDAALFN